MSSGLRETAPAKVNLSLRIVARHADGYHDLESLVAFAGIGDAIRLEPSGVAPTLVVTGPFAVASGPVDDNLVLRAVRTAGLPSGAFHLDKQLPVAAGLGGGSSDAAAALRLVARHNDVGIDDPRIVTAARQAGADVPVCLDPRARVMRGHGDCLSAAVALPPLVAVLVNPGVAVPTPQVFAQLRGDERSVAAADDVPSGRRPLIDWLAAHPNDLTAAAIRCAPEIADVLAALAGQPGCLLSRMSGSGGTCFGLFDGPAEAADAAGRLASSHGHWWVRQTLLSGAASLK